MGMQINNNKINNIYSKSKNTDTYKNNDKNINFSDTLSSKISLNKNVGLDAIFNKASEKYDIPVNLLKAVAKSESNFNSNAESNAGAQGIMQLMPGTARSLGVTNSFDPEQNIMGGAKYLRMMLDKFDGKIDLALAAYNAGPGNVQKYGGIPPFQETQNYIVKVLGQCDESIDIASSKLHVTSNELPDISSENRELFISNSFDNIFSFSNSFDNIFSDGNISKDEIEFIINAYKNNLI